VTRSAVALLLIVQISMSSLAGVVNSRTLAIVVAPVPSTWVEPLPNICITVLRKVRHLSVLTGGILT
jgi:hypothetical protein